MIPDGAERSGDRCLPEGGEFDFICFFLGGLLEERHFLCVYCWEAIKQETVES